MILQKTTYSILIMDGIKYAYAVDLDGKLFKFETLEEARRERKSYAMLYGEQSWILKETREIVLDSFDENIVEEQEEKNEV